MDVVINGERRAFPELGAAACVADLVGALALKGDRVAIERNGEIVRRPEWDSVAIASGDRFEIVHFVGGGCAREPLPRPRNAAGLATDTGA